jgi:predicted nucleic acid-binding Zn ribbon protein
VAELSGPERVERAKEAGQPAELAALDRVMAGPKAAKRVARRGGGTEPEWQTGRDPAEVGELVDQYLAREGWEHQLSVGSVVARWEEIAGKEVAEHCQPESFDDGRLVVRAVSSPWATQIRLLLPQLTARIDRVVGAGVVTSVTVLGPAAPAAKRGQWTVRTGRRTPKR